jgi:transposase
MSGKPKRMSQIKQILQLHKQGKKNKTIADALGVARKTVRKTIERMHAGGWTIDELLALEDPEVESRLYAGNAAYTEEKFQRLKGRLDYYAAELKRHGVTKRLLWEEYKAEFPDGYGHSQFQHHLLQHIRATNPTMVLKHKPGEKLMIDFAGKTTSYIDRETGEIITCQLFVACLPYSNYFFAIAVPSQKLEDFIHALTCCIIFLGGVSDVIVPDNMKTAVAKASRYEPKINQALEDLANHYGCAVLPTRVARPRDKSAVENHVGIAYTHVYARLRNRQFFSLDDLNKAILECVQRLNQTRMQNKDFSREELFLAEEKPVLRPLPSDRYEIKYHREYTVAKNCHIRLTQDRNYYSVPYTIVGEKVKVIYTRTLVQIYYQGNRVAVHTRNRAPHKYTTVKEHLASYHQQWLDRSPEYYISNAARISEKLSELIKRKFDQDIYPELLYNSCDGILATARKADPDRLAKACEIALDTGVYSMRFLENVLKNKLITAPQEPVNEAPLPKHRNVRGKDYYQQQLTINL